MGDVIIEFDHVTKIYPQKKKDVIALRDVNLKVQKGKIFGIIGLSGAGKSTLIRCINRLETPQSGKVMVRGVDMTTLSGHSLRAARRKIGMIFQHFNLMTSRTVAENIAFPLEIMGMKSETIQSRIRELAELVGLTDKLQMYPSQLSGGQKQRVGIARALANEPEILLCDEATSALDPQTTHSILKLLRDLNLRLGLTIVLITHQIEVVKGICDAVAIIEDGQIIEEGPVVRVFTAPQTETARSLIQTALNAELSEVMERLRSHRREGQGNLVHISFVGQITQEPIIATLIRRFGLNINILYANLDFIQETPFGSLIVEMNGPDAALCQALEFLKDLDCGIEVLTHVESPTMDLAN